MIPLWRPLLATTVAVTLASPARRLMLPAGQLARGPLLVLGALLACYVTYATPWVAIAALVWLAVALTRQPSGGLPARPADVCVLLAVTAAFLLVMLLGRPPTPCFWDAFVWLAKARFASRGPVALISTGLMTSATGFIPQGYPLFEPLSVGLLSGLSADPRAVVAGAVGLEVVALLLFLTTIADDDSVPVGAARMRLATVTVVLLACPLVVVHLRSAYVDLPLGLLVGALAVVVRRPGTGVAAAVLAMSAASLKDEGLAHVMVVTCVGVLWSFVATIDGAVALRKRALGAGIAAFVVAGAWHLRLRVAGVANTDHALSFPEWSRLRLLTTLSIDHMSDFRSWGALWILALGALAATIVFVPPPGASWLAAILVGQCLTVLFGLTSTPARVMTFAAEGSLLNRLGIQIAPCAALLVATWVGKPQRPVPTQSLEAPERSPVVRTVVVARERGHSR